MKKITKSPEPKPFTDWKSQDRMAHQPNWNRVPGPIKGTVHGALLREQGFLCCYCEANITQGNSHVEHFRPKGIGEFEHLQLSYDNLLCSCIRDSKHGAPLHCGHLKGSWFDNELLVSPLAEDCENRFRFTANGDVLAHDNDMAAKTTIKRLGLDIPKLRALRRAALETMMDANLSASDIETLLATKKEDGSFLEFHTTVRQVLLA